MCKHFVKLVKRNRPGLQGITVCLQMSHSYSDHLPEKMIKNIQLPLEKKYDEILIQ